jgi:hypothetical protein
MQNLVMRYGSLCRTWLSRNKALRQINDQSAESDKLYLKALRILTRNNEAKNCTHQLHS